MPSLKDVKMKITGVGKTKQITKAMNMVASAKLRGAQARIEKFRPYAQKYRDVLTSLASKVEGSSHPLLEVHPEKKACAIILVTSDRGLCGGFNAAIIDKAVKLAKSKTEAGMQVKFACVGRKGRDAVRRIPSFEMMTSYADRMGSLDFALASSVAQECILPIVKSVWEAADAGLGDPVEAVCAWAGRLLEAARRLPELPRLWAREFLAGSGALRDRVVPGAVPIQSHSRLIGAVARAQREGRMNPGIDPVLLMPTVIAMVMCPLAAQEILQKVPTVGSIDREALARHVRAFLLAGLASRQ